MRLRGLPLACVCALLLVEGFKVGSTQRDRVIAMLIIFAFNILFWMFFEQAGSSFTFLADKIVDVLKLDINAPEQRVLAETRKATASRKALGQAATLARRDHPGAAGAGPDAGAASGSASQPGDRGDHRRREIADRGHGELRQLGQEWQMHDLGDLTAPDHAYSGARHR